MLLLLIACVQVHVLEGSTTFSESVLEVTSTVPVGSLEAGGNLTGGAEVTWELSYDQSEPILVPTLESGTLTVNVDCSINLICDAKVFIATAPDANVTLDMQEGPIVVHGFSGRVDVATAKGTITFDQLSGETHAGTAEGDIIGTALSSPIFQSGGEKGDHILAFDGTPQSLDSSTVTGNVDITVPSGTYAITTSSPEAATITGLTDDDTAANILFASTQSGTVTLTGN